MYMSAIFPKATETIENPGTRVLYKKTGKPSIAKTKVYEGEC